MDHLVLLAGVAALFMIATVGMAAWGTMRAVRGLPRRLKALAAILSRDTVTHRRITGFVAGRSGIQPHKLGLRTAAARPQANPAWWSAQRERRSLRRSIAAAERTVAAAAAADAPVGELPALCRELRRMRNDIDRRLMLAASHGQQPDGQTRAQAYKARVSAEQIRLLAARAHAEIRMPIADEFAARVDSEAVALTAGLASLGDTRAV
jgi:hypothetical protein